MDTEKTFEKVAKSFPDEQYKPYERNAQRFDALMSRIVEAEQEQHQAKQASTAAVQSAAKESWIDQLNRWIFGAPVAKLRYAAVAACLVIVAQTGMLVYQSSQSGTNAGGYTLASGDDPAIAAQTGASYLVSFDDSVTIAQAESLLAEFGAQQVSLEANSGGVFRVTFAQTLTADQKRSLENNELILFFGEAE